MRLAIDTTKHHTNWINCIVTLNGWIDGSDENRWKEEQKNPPINTQLNALGHTQMHLRILCILPQGIECEWTSNIRTETNFQWFCKRIELQCNHLLHIISKPIKEFNWTFIMHYERSEYGY